jgi:hypothetical protein
MSENEKEKNRELNKFPFFISSDFSIEQDHPVVNSISGGGPQVTNKKDEFNSRKLSFSSEFVD